MGITGWVGPVSRAYSKRTLSAMARASKLRTFGEGPRNERWIEFIDVGLKGASSLGGSKGITQVDPIYRNLKPAASQANSTRTVTGSQTVVIDRLRGARAFAALVNA